MFPKPIRHTNPKVLREARCKPCIVCGRKSDAAHIASRGSGGHDVPQNLTSFCRVCHQEQHAIGICEFLARHPQAAMEFERLGWVVEHTFGRRRLVRKDNLATGKIEKVR
jgi:HNH endonuclease